MTWRTQLIVNHNRFFVATLLILTLCACFAGLQVASAQGNPATAKLKLEAANNAVEGAFQKVSAAEAAGANVANLITQLNSAAGLLAQAENSNQTGDYDTAAAKADAVLPIAQQVTVSAQSAQQAASSQNSFLLLIVFTVIVEVVFVAVLFMVWRWLKARHMKDILEAKPEVPGQ